MATVTINSGTSYQTCKGWEAVCQGGHDTLLPDDTPEYPSTSWANYKDDLLDAMLDLGLNRLRVECRLGDVNATGYSYNDANPATQPTTNPTHFRWERLTYQMDEIFVPYATMLAAATGETLWLNLCVVDFRDAGYDAENTPAEYAEFVYRVVDWLDTNYGIVPDSIETILEPGTGQNITNWTRAKVANNLVAGAERLITEGYIGIEWIAPSVEDGSTTSSWWTDMMSADSDIEDYVTHMSYHRYTAPDATELGNIRDTANAFGASPAMLEHIGADYNELYTDLTIGRVCAWEQFTIAFPYTGVTDDGAAYFEVNTSTWAVTPYSRTEFLRQFFKFIRLGAVMKGVSNSSSNYQGVPFVNSNGTYVVPIRCTASGDIDVIGLPAGTYGIKYTTASNYDVDLSNQVIGTGEDVSFNMPAAGVVTVYNINYIDPPTAPNTPSGLSASRATKTQINLSWTLNGGGESSVVLERSTNLTDWTEIPLSAGAESYNDTGLTTATVYYYRVKAVNGGGSSSYSNQVIEVTTNVYYFGSSEPPIQ